MCIFFFLYKDQCMRYRVYTECWFHKAGDDFVRLSVLYTCVMKKKNVACTSFPGKYFFYTFWILVDKMLIGTMRPRTDMSFWQIGLGKRKTWYLFSIPTWGLFQTSELAGWAQSQSRTAKSLDNTTMSRRTGEPLSSVCSSAFSSKLVLFHVIIGFKHDVACIVRLEALRGHSDTSVHSALRASCTDYPRGPFVPPISQCTLHHAQILK